MAGSELLDHPSYARGVRKVSPAVQIMLGYRRKKSVFRIYEREPITKARIQKFLSEGAQH